MLYRKGGSFSALIARWWLHSSQTYPLGRHISLFPKDSGTICSTFVGQEASLWQKIHCILHTLYWYYVSSWRNSFQQSMAHGVICCHTDFGCMRCRYYDGQPLRILPASFRILSSNLMSAVFVFS